MSKYINVKICQDKNNTVSTINYYSLDLMKNRNNKDSDSKVVK
jgi:hypothetical protein